MARRVAPLLFLLALLVSLLGWPAAAQAPVSSSPPDARGESGPTAASSSFVPSPSASGSPGTAQVSAPPGAPVVRGVFFFSPTCGHCEKVITEDLPGFFELAGGKPGIAIDEAIDPGQVAFYLMSNGSLQLLMVDVSVDPGARMFVADSERLGLDRPGVPRVDIADAYFTGAVDIPERLPAVIEAGLAKDGIGWPAVPGLQEALAPFPQAADLPGPERDDDDAAVVLPAETMSLWERVTRDPLGNGIAIIVLALLLLSLVLVPLLALRDALPTLPTRLAPWLALLGIAVSAYLGMVETNELNAVCGPVGDCNAVQQSEYAKVLGVPIGVLGVIGYGLLLAGWVVSRLVQGRMADVISVGLAVGAFGGVAFSAYLTYLEPFVIGATCMWCITSALTILALLWLLAGPARDAWRRLRGVRGAHLSPRGA